VPDHCTIARFRQFNEQELVTLLTQLLQMSAMAAIQQAKVEAAQAQAAATGKRRRGHAA
jgi:hypothetical protein